LPVVASYASTKPVKALAGQIFAGCSGIVTVDDIVGVIEREAGEDIQKIGGSAAIDEHHRSQRNHHLWLLARAEPKARA
jgi:hypothetical protein